MSFYLSDNICKIEKVDYYVKIDMNFCTNW